MAKQNQKRLIRLVLVVVLIVLFVILVSHIWIKNTIKDVIEPDKQVVTTPLQQPTIQEPVRKKESTSRIQLSGSTGEVIEKIWVQRGGEYMESVFYRGGQVIARQKSDKSGVFEQEGQIPDGKVKFYDYHNNTYGEAQYKDNKKDNRSDNRQDTPTLTYYSNGNLRSESTYKNGKLQTKKEYYGDGILSMEADYTDAREFPGIKEKGRGKSYFRNGKLKYEWNFTKSHRVGVRKCYDRNGLLRSHIRYDEQGKPRKIR